MAIAERLPMHDEAANQSSGASACTMGCAALLPPMQSPLDSAQKAQSHPPSKAAFFERLCTLATLRQLALTRSIKSLAVALWETPQGAETMQLHWKGLVRRCSRLVMEVEAFQRWVSQGRCSLSDHFAKFKGCHAECRTDPNCREEASTTPAPRWITEDDVSIWLLKPAQRCHALAKGCMRTVTVQGLLRKVLFWVDELKVGAYLAGFRVCGKPLPGMTQVRFHLFPTGPGLNCLCIKNTFVDLADRSFQQENRAHSEPPRILAELPRNDSTAQEDLQQKPMKTERLIRPEPTTLELIPPKNYRWQEVGLQPAAMAKSLEQPEESSDKNKSNIKSTRCPLSAHWWTKVPDMCPLAKFPVSLLPYPPFKFQTSSMDGLSTALVDGGFVVVQVLASLRFEVLGRRLTDLDVRALDHYMKRCRLGSLRLTKALELMQRPDPEAKAELASLCGQTRCRLAFLKQIQKTRMARWNRC